MIVLFNNALWSNEGKIAKEIQILQPETLAWSFCMENTTICCLGKYLEVRGMKDVLSAKNFFGSNIVNYVAEGSCY